MSPKTTKQKQYYVSVALASTAGLLRRPPVLVDIVKTPVDKMSWKRSDDLTNPVLEHFQVFSRGLRILASESE